MQEWYLNEKKAAKRLGRTPGTLKLWRHKKIGPEYLKDKGGKIWYTEDALKNFIEGE